jgi:hypothetical protein
MYLLELCDEGSCHTDEEYVLELERATGTSASISTVQRYLTNELVSQYSGDVVVLDNWSGHTSATGEALRDLLRDEGVELVYLPAKFSELNPIEHCWRTVKAHARRMRHTVAGLRPDVYMMSGCESITHAEILFYTLSCGYGVDEAAKANVMSFSDFPERATKKNRH